MYTVSCKRSELCSTLYHSLFSDRGRQFVDRHKWDLCVSPGGLELDEYDTDDSHYIAVCEAAKHLGSCRVRHCGDGTMLLDHFRSVFPNAAGFLKMQRGRVFELTRFCRSPDMSVEQSARMLGVLAEELDQFRDRKNLVGFVAVVFPAVARFLDRIGVRYLTLDSSYIDGKRVQMICITHAVAADARRPSNEAVPVDIAA